ncbi:MAG: penicillin-binding transpeptidase domain-containing protein, partial [Candidatus Woesebacteria bacterium]|nr:penicillin-binding transpeptidase domain-containing protein [Candidatus Woesebacteria bacterium]
MQTLASSKNNESWLSWFLRGVLLLGFLVLIGRLIDLQLIKGEYYRKLSEGNRIERIKIKATRGKILARGGEVLSGSNFSHLIGYLAETNANEVGKIDPKCIEKGAYKLGQIVGRGGLSEYYNCHLTGVDGEELIEVDSKGKKLRSLGIKYPISGSDLRTNIDFNLQNTIANEMVGKSGAVIATDKNGEVLALFSSPSFDPDDIPKSLDDPELPLFNRSIGGLYHPGSIFKPLVAIAALEEGKIDKNYKYTDTGIVTVESIYGNFSYTNWYFTQYGGKEGEIDLTKALARSTDTFFYKIGEAVGINSLVDWMKNFGLTKLTDIDIPGEIISLIPSPDWKEKIKKEKWFLGNTYHFSIGQGDLALTPVGIHRANLVIANGGKFCNLKIVGETNCQKTKIKEENINLVKEGMKKVCIAGGTGFTFFDFSEKHNGIEVGCKTGTAETNEDDKTHAWFTVFAPLENPEIMLTVMVEKSGEGSKVAGPIARNIFNYYFE